MDAATAVNFDFAKVDTQLTSGLPNFDFSKAETVSSTAPPDFTAGFAQVDAGGTGGERTDATRFELSQLADRAGKWLQDFIPDALRRVLQKGTKTVPAQPSAPQAAAAPAPAEPQAGIFDKLFKRKTQQAVAPAVQAATSVQAKPSVGEKLARYATSSGGLLLESAFVTTPISALLVSQGIVEPDMMKVISTVPYLLYASAGGAVAGAAFAEKALVEGGALAMQKTRIAALETAGKRLFNFQQQHMDKALARMFRFCTNPKALAILGGGAIGGSLGASIGEHFMPHPVAPVVSEAPSAQIGIGETDRELERHSNIVLPQQPDTGNVNQPVVDPTVSPGPQPGAAEGGLSGWNQGGGVILPGAESGAGGAGGGGGAVVSGPIENIVAKTGAVIQGSVTEAANPLKYGEAPWQLLNNGVDNTLQLIKAMKTTGSIDQATMASKLQEAATLWSEGKLDPKTQPDLWSLFHLSNGTESVFQNLQNNETVKSLQNLGVVK